MSTSDLGKSKHGIPDVVMVKIDNYVDSLAPQIQPKIAEEIADFQTKTLDSLDDQVVNAFRSLFDKKGSGQGGRREDHSSRSLDASPPDAYGIESLPFADEIAGLSRSFSKIADDANDDLREILNLTEVGDAEGGGQQSRGFGQQQGDSFSDGARGFLSAAIDAVTEHSRPGSGGGQKVPLDGLLGVLSNTIKETSRNPEEKARLIGPEIKAKIGETLQRQHAPLAEQFTRIAMDHIKRWLRGNTSTRDLGDGLKGEISGLVTGIAGMFGSKKHSDDGARDMSHDSSADESSGGGFSRVISDKLSTGLAKVHREVRLEFRSILGGIEKQMFEALPDQVQGPLEKILGGNPFDSSLDASSGHNSSRGFGDDIKEKLVGKIRQLVRRVQESLRESILSVVNGGHRKFERSSWVFVQNMVEVKVQKFLPDVRINVPDDIGNEGVSVGQPQTPPGMQKPAGSGGRPPSQGQQYSGHSGERPHEASPSSHAPYGSKPQTHSPPPSYHPPSGTAGPDNSGYQHSGHYEQGHGQAHTYDQHHSYGQQQQSYGHPPTHEQQPYGSDGYQPYGQAQNYYGNSR